jgi:cytidine deaminase
VSGISFAFVQLWVWECQAQRALIQASSNWRKQLRDQNTTLTIPGPYSLFRVGSSLLIRSSSSAPTLLTGANVENASYPVGTCAERVAMGSAVMQGYKLGAFKAIGVATDMDDFCSPCGMCRQFLREFCELETPIFMFDRGGRFVVKTLGELLPMSFGPDMLPPREKLERKA